MGWFSVLIALANHNADIRQLMDRGYALRFDSKCLVVRDIPYLSSQLELCYGAIVSKLVFTDQNHVLQDDHQIYFAGDVPHGLNGQPIPNLAGGATTMQLAKPDVVVQRSFSNKPPNGFANLAEKIDHYVTILAGPALSRFPDAKIYTFDVDHDVVEDSIFKFHDTLTSRAEIGDLAAKFKEDVVALIGLGGTGSYLLDFLVKTNVKEVRGFDSDAYYIHNAYRSPGSVLEAEFRRPKVDVYQARYDNFRHGLKLVDKFIDASCAEDLAGVTFAFVCVDKGSARKEIFDLLIALGIAFIDVGMGLNRQDGALAGMMRATLLQPATAADILSQNLIETSDQPGDEYRTNIQIAELNAINAGIAVLRYKQWRGFYASDAATYHLVMDTASTRLFSFTCP